MHGGGLGAGAGREGLDEVGVETGRTQTGGGAGTGGPTVTGMSGDQVGDQRWAASGQAAAAGQEVEADLPGRFAHQMQDPVVGMFGGEFEASRAVSTKQGLEDRIGIAQQQVMAQAGLDEDVSYGRQRRDGVEQLNQGLTIAA